MSKPDYAEENADTNVPDVFDGAQSRPTTNTRTDEAIVPPLEPAFSFDNSRLLPVTASAITREFSYITPRSQTPSDEHGDVSLNAAPRSGSRMSISHASSSRDELANRELAPEGAYVGRVPGPPATPPIYAMPPPAYPPYPPFPYVHYGIHTPHMPTPSQSPAHHHDILTSVEYSFVQDLFRDVSLPAGLSRDQAKKWFNYVDPGERLSVALKCLTACGFDSLGDFMVTLFSEVKGRPKHVTNVVGTFLSGVSRGGTRPLDVVKKIFEHRSSRTQQGRVIKDQDSEYPSFARHARGLKTRAIGEKQRN